MDTRPKTRMTLFWAAVDCRQVTLQLDLTVFNSYMKKESTTSAGFV
jgi:hypothetical protein